MIKIGNTDISKLYIGSTECIRAYQGNDIVYGDESPTCPLYIKNIDSTITTVSIVNRTHTGITLNTDLKYSMNNRQTWVQWDYVNDNITLKPGERVFLRGNNPDGFSKYVNNTNQDIKQIYITGGKAEVSGNIMGLIDDGECTATTLPCDGCFFGLFGWYGFESAQEEYPSIKYANHLLLPASAVTSQGYTYMFRECKYLITAPKLPASSLSAYAYNRMFAMCDSLLIAPELPATTLADRCYNSMFNYCTSLINIPVLPATTLANNCYVSMFWGCTSLETVPSNMLPAATLASGCYNDMFEECTSLTTAPVLPATTLSQSCYAYMFLGCTSLNYIKCLAVSGINTNNSTNSWVASVASNGRFIKNPNATTWPSGNNGIPTGWTVVG